MPSVHRTVFGVLGVMLLIVAVQSLVPKRYVPIPREPVQEVACEGEAIRVDYAFTGGYLEPWACQQQCEDQVRHYVLYSNGKATQCDPLPGCNDWGEDQGVTCKPQV